MTDDRRPVVFLGPTLAAARAKALLDADYRPPAAKGDVYEAAKTRPPAIGIIDGYFQGRPAVWHKEILWALSQGIAVFGAASMGALRAAELAPFGMAGVGEIFERFAAGELRRDDEVAVEHGPAEIGYARLSVALVDIRATLARARAERVAGKDALARLEEIAAASFYPLRYWQRLIATARAEGVAADQMTRFAAWLVEGEISQKELDAERLLERLGVFLAGTGESAPAAVAFEPTLLWQYLVAEQDNPFLRSLREAEE